MKKVTALLSALLLMLCVLSGCAAEETTAPHTHEDLTIHIPTDYIDLTGEEFAESLTFVYGLDPIAINGLREEKATFTAYGLDLDLQTYGKLLMASNQVTEALEERDGIPTFSYEANGYTYVVTLWETQEAFWTVQAYCPTENFVKSEKKMWNILSSVTV